MKKLHLTKVNPGSYSKDKPFYERLKTFNNGLVEILETSISIKSKDGKTFISNLQKTDEDFLSETFQGSFEDGTSFRLLKPGGVEKKMIALTGKGECISFAGMTYDGYAVHFDVVNSNESDI